jgi:hypothetical protein
MTRAEAVAAIREKARVLAEARQAPHPSCGMAVAEAFGRNPLPYQALRLGGVTGVDACGAILAGGLVLGELFGYPDPAAPISLALREAMVRYHREVARRVPRAAGGGTACRDLTAPFGDFDSGGRALYCTAITATVAEIVAEITIDLGGALAPARPR